ncbi:MAG: metallophosphoesterase [Deltaproteobacteria bacterium]|nr:metallophosphoesterase [Deltaproteobacteria bacterium]MDQ3297616.1 metallophosphoesterase [Myxococcota bacterium]
MRATWLTDIHLNFLRPLALKAFYDRVKAEKPDAVLITGDIAEGDSVHRYVAELADHVGKPTYFVLGNHDYYRSNIRVVRGDIVRASKRATYLPAVGPVQLTPRVVMIGVDGWGDARCGDLASTVQLSDWKLIEDFKKSRVDRDARLELLQRLGTAEARTLSEKLAAVPETPELLVLTHVPPFPGACVYDGEVSSPAWQPWFTCIATGEVLAQYAAEHPGQQITVLCGHSHGLGTYQHAPNLVVRTGGWPPHVEGYGNPVVQATLELAR